MLMIGTSFISAAITLQLHFKITLTRPIHGPLKMTWSSLQQRKRSCILISANRGDLSASYILVIVLSLSASQKFCECWSQMQTTRGVHHWQSLTAITFIGAIPSSWCPTNEMLLMYISNIQPILEYACAAWHRYVIQYLTDSIERVQFWTMRIIFPGLSYGDALVSPQSPKLRGRRNDICLSFSKSIEKSDHKQHHLLSNSRTSRYSLLKPPKYESAQTKIKRADGALVSETFQQLNLIWLKGL